MMNSLKRRFSVEDLRALELKCRIYPELEKTFEFWAGAFDRVLRFASENRDFAGVDGVPRLPCKLQYAPATRFQKVWGSLQVRLFCRGRDVEQNNVEVAGHGRNKLENIGEGAEVAVSPVANGDSSVLDQGMQSRYYTRRRAGWPWISVVPSEQQVYEGAIQQTVKTGTLQEPPPVFFPEIYRHPGTKHPLKVFPLNVPDKICSLLSQYGWSAHTKIELRAMMKEIKFLKSRQIQVVLRRQRHAEVAYGFLQWAMAEGNCKLHIKCFTLVMPLLGRVRKFNLLEQLLKDMEEKGYVPDKIIFTAAMRCYASGFEMQEAMELLAKMKGRGFEPDCVTYSVLIQMFSKARLYQEAIKLYEEMLSLGIATDTQLYNCVICTFGKAGRLDLAYKKLEEMRERGHIPDQFTYGVLIEGYAKAGRRAFLDLYKEMQHEGIPLNEVIFNILFLGISRIGTLEDAEAVFADMEQVGLAANLNAFATLIGMCSKSGKASEAQNWFDKMRSFGLKPTMAIANALLDGYARAKQFTEAGKVLDSFLSWGLVPNLQTFTVCLRCLSLCERKEDGEVVQRMLSCHEGSHFLRSLLDSSTPEKNIAPIIAAFLSTLQFEKRQFRRDFVDVLINYLYQFGFRSQGNQVWEEALASYIFPSLVEQGPEGICSVNLQNMEYGTAVVALTRTFPRLIKQFHRKEMTPEWVQIITGPVREEPPTDATTVHQAVAVLLQTLNSPFRVDTLQTVSGFVGRGEDVTNWLDEPQVKAMLAFKH